LKKPKIIHESDKLSRVLEISLNDKKLSTPTYFPAISTYGIKFPFNDLLGLISDIEYPRVLISAYDLYYMKGKQKSKALSLANRYIDKGFLFLDSGLFESSMKRSIQWNLADYKSILSEINFDLHSSFDVYRKDFRSHEDFKKTTYDNILESSVFLNNGAFLAILHAPSTRTLIKIVQEFVSNYPTLCSSIAVAERDIGKSIQERAETLVAIRTALNESNPKNFLHLLGCGNPLSMVLYSYCGVDSFDSLDWVKFAINPVDYSINDFSQLGLLDCKCQICTRLSSKNTKRGYLRKVLLHNLLFYQNFVKQIQSLIKNDNIKAYVQKHIGEKSPQVGRALNKIDRMKIKKTDHCKTEISPQQAVNTKIVDHSKNFVVFIGYRRDTGEDFATHLKCGLEREGIKCFLDTVDIPKEFKETQTWISARNDGIKKSNKFLLIITNGIETSTELKKEIQIARDNNSTFLLYRYQTLKPKIVLTLEKEKMDLGKYEQICFDSKEDLLRKVLTVLK